MSAASPTLGTVLDAVVAAINGISSIGTALGYDAPLASLTEFIDKGGYVNQTTGTMNLWLCSADAPREVEGEAVGEVYVIYPIRIRYLSSRKGEADWSREALDKAVAVMDAVSKATSVFAISSQRQLRTPETISVRSNGFTTVEGQLLYEVVLVLEAEARRWT